MKKYEKKQANDDKHKRKGKKTRRDKGLKGKQINKKQTTNKQTNATNLGTAAASHFPMCHFHSVHSGSPWSCFCSQYIHQWSCYRCLNCCYTDTEYTSHQEPEEFQSDPIYICDDI